MTPEERAQLIRDLEVSLELEKRRLLTHPAPSARSSDLPSQAAQVFGVPPSMIDTAEPLAGVGQRYGQGFLADQPPEAEAFYQQQYPSARVEQVGDYIGVQQAPPSGPVQFPNLPGLDVGDIAEIGGAATLPLAAGLAATATRNPFMASIIAQPLTELVREGVQAAAGTQQETPIQYGTRAGLAVAGEIVPEGLVRGIRAVRSRLGRVAPRLSLSDEELAEATALADQGFNDLALMNYQKSDNPVLQRMADQILQLTGAERAKVTTQLEGLTHAARTAVPGYMPEGFVGPPSPSPDWTLQESLARQYEREASRLKPRPAPTAAGLRLQDLTRNVLGSRKQQMRAEYDRLEQLVERWKPKYDITAAQRVARERRVPGMAFTPEQEAEIFGATGPALVDIPEGATLTGEPLGATWFKKNPQYFNVADPNQRLARVQEVLARLDPRQDYAALKELRTQVGRILDMPLAQKMESNVDIGQAKELYGSLSSALANPLDVVGGVRQGLINQGELAGASARNYYDTYDQSQVRQVLASTQGQTPTGVWNALAENPSAWEPEFRRVVSEGTPDERTVMRQGLDTMLRNTSDPLGTLQQWEKSNPDALDWVYSTPREKRAAYQTAKQINDLEKGINRTAWETASEQQGFARMALEDRLKVRQPHESNRQAAERLVREAGGAGSMEHRALRSAAISSALEPSIQQNTKYGVMGVEPNTFSEGLETLKEKGWWDGVLTDSDRDFLRKLGASSKRTWSKGDAGTGLTVAAQVGKLRGSGGVTGMVEAYGSLTLARVLSHLVTAKQTPKDLLLSTMPKKTLSSRQLAEGMKWASRTLRSEFPAPEDEEPIPQGP